jgi:hypothetical protein
MKATVTYDSGSISTKILCSVLYIDYKTEVGVSVIMESTLFESITIDGKRAADA